MAVIDIEVTMDTICPYSYLGKKSLEKAISDYAKTHPEDEFEIVYKPFYLLPDVKRSCRFPSLSVPRLAMPAVCASPLATPSTSPGLARPTSRRLPSPNSQTQTQY